MKYYELVFILLSIFCSSCNGFESCLINVDCENCVPENIPYVTSYTPLNGIITVVDGDEVILSCHRSRFSSYPNKNMLKIKCENGTFIVWDDSSVRHISELGCKENYFKNVPHQVNLCSYKGRSFQYFNSFSVEVEHLAEICYDSTNKRTVFAHMITFNANDIVQDGNHNDQSDNEDYVKNYDEISDKLDLKEFDNTYLNDTIMDKKMKMLFSEEQFNFANQSVVATKLLPLELFHQQLGRVTDFSVNKIALWASIANGNFKNIHRDLIDNFCFNETSNIEIFSGTHEVLTLSTKNGQREVYLKPNKQFPVPKYVYTIVYDKIHHKAIALVTLNNPFISLSEIKPICKSKCLKISWLKNLTRNFNFQSTLYGITVCCDLHSFTSVVPDAPNLISNVFSNDRGLLSD